MKKVLFLGYEDCRILRFLKKQKRWNSFFRSEKISSEEISEINPDLVVSYGYRHILKSDAIAQCRDRIINLHISYLPWNRGADPNLWSILEGTPKGVSIHMLDEGIDTGDILFQKKVTFKDSESLSSSYDILQEEIQDLFIKNWPSISQANFRKIRKKQDLSLGSFHLKKEGQKILRDLSIKSWDLTVSEVKSRQDEQIINEIQKIRAKNNTHWMDVVKLAFKIAPDEARAIFKKIKYCDERVNELLKELADND